MGEGKRGWNARMGRRLREARKRRMKYRIYKQDGEWWVMIPRRTPVAKIIYWHSVSFRNWVVAVKFVENMVRDGIVCSGD